MTRVVVPGAILACILLASCASPAPTNSNEKVAAPAASANSSPAGGTAGQSSSSSDQGGAKSFGSTFTWSDGVAVTVSKPNAFEPSDTAAVAQKAKSYVVVEVTVKNGSKKAVEPMMVNLRASSGDQQADAVFDTAKGIDMPSAPVQPGRTMKWKAAFAKPGPDFVLTVDWNFGNESGTYQ